MAKRMKMISLLLSAVLVLSTLTGCGDNSKTKGTTSIEIPMGTEFVDEDGSSSKLLVIENKFILNIEELNPEVCNDIKISFESINGEEGFYFKAEIVAGPDKGKIIGAEAYGEWMSPSLGYNGILFHAWTHRIGRNEMAILFCIGLSTDCVVLFDCISD